MTKKFFRDGSDFAPLAAGLGSCIATDRISVDGAPVGYMYREEPDDETDSGWRFFAGDESQEYLDDPNNIALYKVNTIANYDPRITPYLHEAPGKALVRAGDAFVDDPAGVNPERLT